MQELSTNEETEWVEHLVAEMVDGVSHMRHSPDAMHIMKESLALPCLGEEFVEEQLGVSPDLLQALCYWSSCWVSSWHVCCRGQSNTFCKCSKYVYRFKYSRSHR